MELIDVLEVVIVKSIRNKICLPDSIKNISVKSLDLISQRLGFKNISFHKTCKLWMFIRCKSL